MIPPEVAAFVEDLPLAARRERRYRILDWVIPPLMVVLAFAQEPHTLLGQVGTFVVGAGAGMVVLSGAYRRRSYKNMVKSVQQLSLLVSYALTESEED